MSEEATKKLTIVVASIQAVGHVNSCAGALMGALRRGHRIIFIINKMFEGKLTRLGYEEHVFTLERAEFNLKRVNPGELLAQTFQQAKVIGPYSPMEKMLNMFELFGKPEMLKDSVAFDAAIKVAIEKYKPDVFYVDGQPMPALYYSGIPWINSISPNPLFWYDGDDLPPGGFGLPSNSDPATWPQYAEPRKRAFSSKAFNDLFESLGYPRYPNDTYPMNADLTVYAYPEELNYAPFRALPWFNLEVFSKNTTKVTPLETLVPEAFLKDNLGGTFSGHLVYVSMGSMGSIDLDLMTRLLKALAKTPHKYLVSQGPLADKLTLTANMWGAPFLPQLQLLPHVDLVITHGGNNSVTETFAEGKPMLVLGLFGDQFDNAQRLEEQAFGARLDPYGFTEDQLDSTLRRMLADEELKKRCKAASERIKAIDRHEELARKIEDIVVRK